MLDPDGQGIILTNSTFSANISEYNTIKNYEKSLPENMTSSVYSTRDGVFLDISQGGQGTTIKIYNSFFPQFGNSVIAEGTLFDDMKIGKSHSRFHSIKKWCISFRCNGSGKSLWKNSSGSCTCR